MINSFMVLTPEMIAIIIAVALWETVWKAIAMWKSARLNQKVWYVVLIIINSAGILPILYLIFFRENKNIKRAFVVKNEPAKPKRIKRSYVKTAKKTVTKRAKNPKKVVKSSKKRRT